MQYVAKQHCVEALIAYGKVAAVVGQKVDLRRGAGADVESDHRVAE
jgi:hypothetical protein